MGGTIAISFVSQVRMLEAREISNKTGTPSAVLRVHVLSHYSTGIFGHLFGIEQVLMRVVTTGTQSCY